MFTKSTPPVATRRGRPSRFTANDIKAFLTATKDGSWVIVDEVFETRNKANTFGVSLRREATEGNENLKVRTRVVEVSETEYRLYATSATEKPAK